MQCRFINLHYFRQFLRHCQSMAMKDIDKNRLKKFGAHLKEIRQSKGLSVRELASQCDVDFSKISKMENNNGNITLTTLFELAEGLGVHPKELLDMDF